MYVSNILTKLQKIAMEDCEEPL